MKKLMVILLGISAVSVYAQNQSKFVNEYNILEQKIQSQPQEVRDAYSQFKKTDFELISTLAHGANPPIVNGHVANTNIAITGGTEMYIVNYINKYKNDPAKLSKLFNQGSKLLEQLTLQAKSGNQSGVATFLNIFNAKVGSESVDDNSLSRLIKHAEKQSGIKINENFTSLSKPGQPLSDTKNDSGLFIGSISSKTAREAGIDLSKSGSSSSL